MASNVPQEVQDLVKQEEGFRDDVYSDAEGYSAGYGHFLSEEELKKYPPGTKVPQDQIDAWFEEDISRSYAAAQAQNQQLPRPVDVGRLTSVNFQLGTAWNLDHDRTWAKMQAGDFEGAAIEALDSKWAKTQTPGRAKKFSDALTSLGQGPAPDALGDPGTEAVVAASEPTPSDPTPSAPVASSTDFSAVFPGMARSGGVVPPVGQPGGAIANMLMAQEAVITGMAQPDVGLADPSTVGEKFAAAASAGYEQIAGDLQRFGAIYNLLVGDEKAAERNLNVAKMHSEVASELLSGFDTFEQFTEAPTAGGFFDQVLKAVGQFTPIALSSISTGLGGAAVQMLGRGALSIASKKVTNEVMKDIVKKHVLAQQGRGPALSRSEQRILDAAYDTVKKARAGQGELFGASPAALVAAGTRDSGKRASLQYGFLAGAGAQEYVMGSAQSLAEFEEAGRELTAEESRLALAMGIPQTALGLIADKLFLGDIFKRVAGKHADAVRRGATKQADEYAGWMAEIAKGAVSGFAKGATAEGLTELAQEELFIQQRFAIDSEYNQTEANLRRAESAFAGFFAGGTARSPAGAIGNVIGKARAYTTSGRSAVEDLLSGVEDVPRDGSPINEPTSWAAAQITALLDGGTGTRAVWLPNATAASATAAIETATGGNLEAAEKLEIVVGQNENKGILIYDPEAVPDAGRLAEETDFSESFLQDILGYTQPQNPTDTRAVIVRDNQGNVVWSQSVAEDNVDATVARAAELFPDQDKYKQPEVQFKEDAVKERWQKAQEEAQGQRQAGDQQTEFDFDEAQAGDPQDGTTPFTARSMDGTGSDATFVPDTEGLTETDTGGEGRITDPLLKKDMEGKTEKEIAEARANSPVSAWPPRDPEERISDKEFEARKEAEDFFLEYQAKEQGVESLDTTQTLEMGGSSVVIDNNLGRRLKTMPTAFLERFKEEAEQNPSLLLTPKENSDTKNWEIATTPRDVMTRNTDTLSPAARIRDVVINASRHKSRNRTSGWSVRGPDGKTRNVYMGTLIHYGLAIREYDGSNLEGTGRVTDGFNNVYQALRENGYELLYRGEPIEGSTAWQKAPIYDLGKGNIVSLNEAQEARTEIQDPDAPTDAELREELAAIDDKWDARQRYFDEREANPDVPISQMENPYVEVTEEETARKFEIERILNKGLEDSADFEGTSGGPEFETTSIPSADGLENLSLTSLNIQDLGSKGTPSVDPTAAAEQAARKTAGSKRGKVEIDPSWNNAVLGGLWPQLASILKSKLGYGGRDTRIHTAQGLQADFAAGKTPSWMRGTVVQDGQETTVSEILQKAVEEMREAGSLGKYIRFGDTDLIIIDVPANPTEAQQVKSILALGHELGHAIFHQEVDRALDNPKLRNDLIKAWEADRDAGISDSYSGEFGFEEWFADNLGGWLLREARDAKAKNGVESFFKRLADKIRSVFQSLDASLKARFRRNESFDTYVQDVVKSYKDGIPDNNGPPTPSKVIVRNMVDELADTVKPFMPKKALQQIKRKIVALLSVKEELMPNDNRHWSVAYFLQPAHNYLRKFSPELANVFYSMSQSEEKAGHLNARVLLMYQRLNELWKLSPIKETITGKTVPDLDAFETILREAEDDRIPTSQLSPEAQRVRQYLDDFYESYIVGKDSSVGKLTHFYPRILALAEIQSNPEIQANLVALLEEFNPEGPEGVLVDSQGRDVSSFEGIVEALVREGQDNPDNAVPDIADVALGTSESRAKYFKNIPNSRLREIGALEQANTSIRRYVEDMTKRLDYLDKSRTVLTAADIANIQRAERDVQGAFSEDKAGDEVRGWKATEVMLSRIPDETDRAAARDAVKAMLGKTGLGMSPIMRNINSVALSVNIVTYLTFATLASLPDLAGPILRSKDLSWDNLTEGVKQARRYFTETQEMQQFARDIGVVTFDSLSTSLMQSSELGHMTPTAQRASDLFFKAIGLEWFTNFTRVFAAGMGEQFLIRQANLNTDRSSRYLRELGVSREDIRAWDQNGRTFGTPEGKRVQMALGRFVEESIVRPNAAERPVWASNPYTAIVWQLKSFFYAYGKNIVGGAWRETKNRYSEDGTLSSASVPLVLGALTVLPLTMVGLEIREWFKYLGRGGDESAFRSDKMEWGEYSGDIIDRAGVLGPFGLIIPIIEANEFGKSWWVPPLGPSAERLEDLVRGKAKLSDYMPGVAAIR